MDDADWRVRLEIMIATLRTLKPGDFFDERTSRYHSVEREIGALSRAFELDHERLQPILATKPTARACWLPLAPHQLASMDVMEIYWRLGENYADDRWVDGALSGPFETGTLVAALERILSELDTFAATSD